MVDHMNSMGTEGASELLLSTKQNESDFATAIDVKNEDLVTSKIKSQFPSHCIIGEESIGTGNIPPLSMEPTWIIDPIDGTTNFTSGLPLSCVSIGFCQQGRPVMGVAYAPMTQELYIGVDGLGAFRNGVRITSKASKDKTLSNAVVCFEFGYAKSDEGIQNMVQAVQRILQHGCRTTRSLGSGVLDLCYVASGRIDVVYTGIAEEGWKPWDYCAATIILQEAGCIIQSLHNPTNTSFDMYSSSMIAGVNPTVVKQCREVVLKGISD
jgi:myo-inositol-1(or 4)-monophosphatase